MDKVKFDQLVNGFLSWGQLDEFFEQRRCVLEVVPKGFDIVLKRLSGGEYDDSNYEHRNIHKRFDQLFGLLCGRNSNARDEEFSTESLLTEIKQENPRINAVVRDCFIVECTTFTINRPDRKGKTNYEGGSINNSEEQKENRRKLLKLLFAIKNNDRPYYINEKNWPPLVKRNNLTPMLYAIKPHKCSIFNRAARDGLKLVGENFSDYPSSFTVFDELTDRLSQENALKENIDEIGYGVADAFLYYLGDTKEFRRSEETLTSESAGLKSKVWQISPGEVRDGLWTKFTEKNLIAIGWEIGDISEMLKKEIVEALGQKERDNNVQSLYHFGHSIHKGDVIVAKKGASKEVYGIGVVTKSCYFDESKAIGLFGEESAEYNNFIDVDWALNFVKKLGHRINVDDLSKQFTQWTVNSYEYYTELKGKICYKYPQFTTDFNKIEELSKSVCSKEVNYFWVNQTRFEELEGKYLEAPLDEIWHHKTLSELKTGDIIIHYYNKQIVGHSKVKEKAYKVHLDGKEYLKVDLIDYKSFEPPKSVEDIRGYLMEEDVKLDKHYPLDSSGAVNQTYLNKLSLKAGEYLLGEHPPEVNYFWVTANPRIWKVEKIKDGGEIFYSTYNVKGHKRRIFSSFKKAKPGDRVIFYKSTPAKKIVAEGEITRGLHKKQEEGFEEPVDGISIKYVDDINSISWEKLQIPELKNSTPLKNGAQGSIFEITKEEFDTILSLEEDLPDGIEIDEALRNKLELTSSEIDLTNEDGKELVFEDISHLRGQILAALNSGKNIMFIGPPGTGKTEIARRLCQNLRKKDYVLTTATSDWTTFDTIGGYMPKTGKGETGLEFNPGQFLKCFKAGEKPCNKWLIIDEINRADIDKAFGQLFTVLSGQEVEVELPFCNCDGKNICIKNISKEDNEIKPNEYVIPKSWRLIATMNTYDKTSLYEMSYAFMRRFAYIYVGVPSKTRIDELWKEYLSTWDLNEINNSEKIKEIWKTVNKHRKIGPAIVKDMLEYLDKGATISGAIIAYVLPQLEGLKKESLEEITKSLLHLVDSESERKELTIFAEELFPHISINASEDEG